jgi:hypothetical protein
MQLRLFLVRGLVAIVWAVIFGALRLAVAIRRRATLGKQWPPLPAGGGSTVLGIAFIVMSGADDPRLRMIAVYAAAGGIEFAIQAWLLARRSHQAVPAT